jgi:uncharacterized protein with gpF-like domain
MADVRLERALDNAEPALRDAFLDMIETMGAAVPTSELIGLLQSGRFDEALARTLRSATRLPREATRQFINAANDVARQINRRLGEIIIDFDQTNPFAVRAMRNNQLRLVQGFTTQQRLATRRALIDGQREGLNPREMARRFRQSIGLNARQVQAVSNFRTALQSLDPAALRRELRDARFDRTIINAIKNNQPLTQSQIDKMVDRYSDRQLKYRAEMIARTEALRSVHEGNNAMFQQAFEEGVLDPAQITREWNSAKDDRVRDTHSAMHGQTVGAQEVFTSPSGATTMYPGGFGVGAEDIHCRCAVGTRINSVVPTGGVTGVIL